MGALGREGTRVRITYDLSRYDPRFIVGATGVIIPDAGMWARQDDRFVSIMIDGGGILDVLGSSYERIEDSPSVTEAPSKASRIRRGDCPVSRQRGIL